jgi:hypothetical protein
MRAHSPKGSSMSLSQDLRSIPGLFGDAVEQLGKLVQNEAHLARTEMADKMTQAFTGGAYVAAAAILISPVLVLLLLALAAALNEAGLGLAVSFLVSAAVGAVVSGALAMIGKSYLKPAHLTPRVTLQQVSRDIATAKELAR